MGSERSAGATHRAWLVSVILAFASTARADVPPPYMFSWGTGGSAPGQFLQVFGIATDASGTIYTCEGQGGRIQVFGASGSPVRAWSTTEGQTSIACDPNGFLYVVVQSESSPRVMKYTLSGALVTQWGSAGSGDGQFAKPFSVAVDGSGHVFVSDWELSRITEFTGDGTFIRKWGEPGSGNGQFNTVDGIACDPAGNIYAVDRYNNRIQKFSGNGEYITQWGTFGSGDHQFFNPVGVTCDQAGNVYVTDTGLGSCIREFDGQGTFVNRWSSYGTGAGQLQDAWALTVQSNGNVYVADGNASRVTVFGTAPAAVSDGDLSEGALNVAPNPTRSGTQLQYVVARAGQVRIELLDVSGRVVATLADGIQAPGRYAATWDGTGQRGRPSPGLYFVRLMAPGEVTLRKLAILE